MRNFRSSELWFHLFVIILSPWWWFVLRRNSLISFILFALSFIVFVYFYLNRSAFLLKILVILSVILVFFCIRQGYDETIISSSALEIQQYFKRHEYYAQGFGKIYTNKLSLTYFKNFSLPLYKLQRNFFSNLDPNLYFFASHPRERLGISEFEKYLPIFIPFFWIGFLYICFKKIMGFFIYLLVILLASIIVSPSYNLGPILFFPTINFIITIGCIICLRYLKK